MPRRSRPGPRRARARALAAVVYVALLAWSAVVVVQHTTAASISVLCSSIDDACRAWAEGFTDRTGVAVDMVRMSTGEALARLSRPDGADDFDVWHGGPADLFEIAGNRGLLAAYRSPAAAAIPERYRDPDGYWTGTYLGVLGFCSNRNVLADLGVAVPTTWDDLLDAALAREVSAPNPLSSGSGYALVWTTRVRTGDDAATLDYLRALDRSVLQYTASGLAPARVAGRGEVAVAVTFSQHCVKAQEAGYEDLVVSYPADGTGAEVGAVAVLAAAPDPAAARRYVDYALSAAGQSAGDAADSVQLPTRDDLPADPRLGADAPLLESEAADAARARERLLELAAQVVR